MPERIEHKFINNVEHKYCSGCKKYYVLSEFIRDSSCWDKLYYLCSECRRKVRKPDTVKKSNKQSWERKKKVKNYSKIQYAETNKDKLYLRIKRSRSREEYKEHVKAKGREWARENKDRLYERNRKYREERKKRIEGYVTVCDKCGKQCEFGIKSKKRKAYHPTPQERFINRRVVLCSSCYDLLIKCETKNERYLFWEIKNR